MEHFSCLCKIECVRCLLQLQAPFLSGYWEINDFANNAVLQSSTKNTSKTLLKAKALEIFGDYAHYVSNKIDLNLK